jgi:uncharacterized membrane protein
MRQTLRDYVETIKDLRILRDSKQNSKLWMAHYGSLFFYVYIHICYIIWSDDIIDNSGQKYVYNLKRRKLFL